ncbi:hypothetical protein FQZ97_807610 [compost metagenome]
MFRLAALMLCAPRLTSAPWSLLSKAPENVALSAPDLLDRVPPALLSRLPPLTDSPCQPENRPWWALISCAAFRTSWPALMIRPWALLSMRWALTAKDCWLETSPPWRLSSVPRLRRVRAPWALSRPPALLSSSPPRRSSVTEPSPIRRPPCCTSRSVARSIAPLAETSPPALESRLAAFSCSAASLWMRPPRLSTLPACRFMGPLLASRPSALLFSAPLTSRPSSPRLTRLPWPLLSRRFRSRLNTWSAENRPRRLSRLPPARRMR